MRSITSFAVRQHRFPTANENDVCAYGTKRCSSLRSEIRPKGSAHRPSSLDPNRSVSVRFYANYTKTVKSAGEGRQNTSHFCEYSIKIRILKFSTLTEKSTYSEQNSTSIQHLDYKRRLWLIYFAYLGITHKTLRQKNFSRIVRIKSRIVYLFNSENSI